MLISFKGKSNILHCPHNSLPCLSNPTVSTSIGGQVLQWGHATACGCRTQQGLYHSSLCSVAVSKLSMISTVSLVHLFLASQVVRQPPHGSCSATNLFKKLQENYQHLGIMLLSVGEHDALEYFPGQSCSSKEGAASRATTCRATAPSAAPVRAVVGRGRAGAATAAVAGWGAAVRGGAVRGGAVRRAV